MIDEFRTCLEEKNKDLNKLKQTYVTCAADKLLWYNFLIQKLHNN